MYPLTLPLTITLSSLAPIGLGRLSVGKRILNVPRLSNHSVNMAAVDHCGWTISHRVSLCSSIETDALEKIRDFGDIDIDQQDYEGKSALFYTHCRSLERPVKWDQGLQFKQWFRSYKRQ